MTEQTKNINNEEFMDEMENPAPVEETVDMESIEKPRKFGSYLKEGFSIIAKGAKDVLKRNKRKIAIGATVLVGGAALTIGGIQLVKDKDDIFEGESDDYIDVTDTAVETTDSSDVNESQEYDDSETEA